MSVKRPWTRSELALLGTASDQVIANRLGRIEAEVYTQRIRRCINSYTGSVAPAMHELSPAEEGLWYIYRLALDGPQSMLPPLIGYLAAKGWAPTAKEIIMRTQAGRSSAYRHAKLAQDVVAMAQR